VTPIRVAGASGRPDAGRGDGTWVARRASKLGVVCVHRQQLPRWRSGRPNIDVWVTDQVLQFYDGDKLLGTEQRASTGEVRKKKASVPGGRSIVKTSDTDQPK
jgi:hypothetical protein